MDMHVRDCHAVGPFLSIELGRLQPRALTLMVAAAVTAEIAASGHQPRYVCSTVQVGRDEPGKHGHSR